MGAIDEHHAGTMADLARDRAVIRFLDHQGKERVGTLTFWPARDAARSRGRVRKFGTAVAAGRRYRVAELVRVEHNPEEARRG